MINIRVWNRTDQTRRGLSPQELLAERDELLASSAIVWVDLANPTPDEEQWIFEQFLPIHSLSLEDVTRLRREPHAPPHLPKIEEFPNYLFVIVNPLTQDYLQLLHRKRETETEDVRPFAQLSAVLTRDVLVTHHYNPLECIAHLEAFLERHSSQMERGPDYLYHLLLDCTVDQYVPVLDSIDDTLDRMELLVARHPRPQLFVRLLRLKRQIIVLRKTLIYEREILVRLARGEFELVDERETIYYRNVYDHLVRFTELIESSREMTSDLMQTFLSAQANHLNQIMKVLTMISTVVLPMTLVAGIYGMNFNRLVPASEDPNGFFIALALMLLSGAASLLYFGWNRWL